MVETNKQNLNLSVEEGLPKKAREQGINISKMTENLLKISISASETGDLEKQYKGFQELCNLMLPLLRKFKVRTKIATEIVMNNTSDDPDWTPDFDPNDNVINDEEIPSEWFNIFLMPDGKLEHDMSGEIKIKDIHIIDFLKPQEIIDNFLDAVQEGVNYRKEQFTQIEMAKTIIDAITKGVIPKTKGKGKK